MGEVVCRGGVGAGRERGGIVHRDGVAGRAGAGHGEGHLVALVGVGIGHREARRVIVVGDGECHVVGVVDAVTAGGGCGHRDGGVGGVEGVVVGGDGDRAGARGGAGGDSERDVVAQRGGGAGGQADGDGGLGAGWAVEAGGDGAGVVVAALVDGGGREPERRYREGFIVVDRDRGGRHRETLPRAEDADGLVGLGDGVVRGREGKGAAAASVKTFDRDREIVPGGVINTLPGAV